MTNSTPLSTKLLFAAQMFFGGWFLLHGINYFVEIFPQPSGSSTPSRVLIGALIQTGLFDFIKIMEIISGVFLLVNRLVPLAALTAVPTTLVVAYVNVLHADWFGATIAVTAMTLITLILLGHFYYFRPMLAWKTSPPSFTAFKDYLGEFRDNSR